MTIPSVLVYEGSNKEFQFRDAFVMPLLLRLGFGVVVNNHGQREFGRDVIFGDVDRFGHVVYYGMQIKYESSISLSASQSLIQDAEQATNNPFKHPQTGREEFISCFYVANAGDISDQARENFFNGVSRKGIRDARLLDANALLLLDKSTALNRNSRVQEQMAGMIQEIRRNRNLFGKLQTQLESFAEDPQNHPFPLLRCRNTATGAYLSAPVSIPNLPIDIVDQYWEMVRMINNIADSVGIPVVAGDFRTKRAKGLDVLQSDFTSHGGLIEKAAMTLLAELNSSSTTLLGRAE